MLCRSIHEGEPPAAAASAAPGENRPRPDQISFGLLLNLASVCHAEDKSVVWGYVVRYAPGVTPESNPLLDRLVGHAVSYYQDFVRPAKQYRAPSEVERAARAELKSVLGRTAPGPSPEDIRPDVTGGGKPHPLATLPAYIK